MKSQERERCLKGKLSYQMGIVFSCVDSTVTVNELNLLMVLSKQL